jgi:hypothetical protein
MINHYAYTTLIFIPITSLASYLAFFRSKNNYFKHLILNSFIAGQKTVVLLVMLPIVYFFDSQKINTANDIFTLSLGILLTFWTYYQFFASTTPLKKIFLTMLTYVLSAIFSMILIILIFVISMIIA